MRLKNLPHPHNSYCWSTWLILVLRLYTLPFLFDLNKNISKTLTEVNICLKPFGKHCLKKKNKKINYFIYSCALFT